MVKNIKSLNAQQVQFCEIYLSDPKRNASRAYAEAYSINNKRRAIESASRLLAKSEIQAYVENRENEMAEKAKAKYEIEKDRVISEFASIAFTNLSDVIEWNNNEIVLKDYDSLPSQVKAAIEIVDVQNNGKTQKFKIKMHDKRAALLSLGKYLGMFKEKGEIDVAGEMKAFYLMLDRKSRDPDDEEEK